MNLQNEPQWIRADVVLAIHEAQISEHGGIAGIRSRELLDSALARPRTLASFDETADLLALGAMCAIAIARNHPFLDGNKRVAWVTMVTFLEINGVSLHFDPMEAVGEMLALASGDHSDEGFTAWVRHAAG